MQSETLGLTKEEVLERIGRGEVNRVKKFTTRTIPAIIANNTLTIFNGILAISVIALFIIQAYIDAIFLLTVTLGNVLLGLFQELRAKWALDRLSLLMRKTVFVIREGKEEEISIDEVVKGDLILLKSGDQIIVDGVWLDSFVTIDESSLTGRGEPVEKYKGDPLFSGCFCLSGSGRYRAVGVGEESTLNKLTSQAKAYKFFLTPLQKEINRLIQGFTLAMILFVILLLMAHFGKNLTVTSSILAIVTMIKSLVPEGLVFISTLALALGAYRAAKEHVLVQKMNAIESMSHLSTLCLDKTGTLGTNNLLFEAFIPLSSDTVEIQRRVQLFLGASREKNLTLLAIQSAFSPVSSEVVGELPFSSVNKYSAVSIKEGQSLLSLWLGMPEIIANDQLTKDQRDLLKELRGKGLRVVLFASSDKALPERENLTLHAFLVLKDELRTDVKEAIRYYESRDVTLKILSGDHPDTVFALAKQAGFTIKGKVISGQQLDSLTPEEFEKAVREVQFFGSLLPRQKQKIIQSLQAQGQFVGMVGDGVNDLFALKQADIGVTMNSAVSAAKDVADIILLKNAFTHLPSLSLEGDRIIYNIKRIARLFLTKNFYSIFFVLFVGFIGFEFPLSPRFITWIDLLTIGIPTTLLTLMKPSLKRQTTQLFIYNLLKFSVCAGITIAFFSLLVFAHFSLFQDLPDLYGRTASTSAIILMSLYVVYSVTEAERSDKNRRLFYFVVWGLIAIGVLLLFPAIYWPPLRDLLGMTSLMVSSWLTIFIASLIGIGTIRMLLRKAMA